MLFNPTNIIDTNLGLIIEEINTILSSQGNKILGIGVTSLGPLDTSKRLILSPVSFHNWHDIAIGDTLSSILKLPVWLENDCKASTLAERMLGKCLNKDDFVYIGIENGVGCGVFINGQLYHGSDGFATELGHTTVDINGEQCACGNVGCLELYLSLPRIVEKVNNAVKLGACKTLNDTLTWHDLVDLARQGEKLCTNAIEQTIPLLSVAAVNAINIFDPSVIILGHDLVLAEDLIVNKLRSNVNAMFLARNNKKVDIEVSAFKNEAPIMGAIALVLDRWNK